MLTLLLKKMLKTITIYSKHIGFTIFNNNIRKAVQGKEEEMLAVIMKDSIKSSNKANNSKFLKIKKFCCCYSHFINTTRWRDLCGVWSSRLLVPTNTTMIGYVWRGCMRAVQSHKKVIWKSYFLITKSFGIIRESFSNYQHGLILRTVF